MRRRVQIFALALLVVFLVLAAQFESFVNPLIILVTVPLAMTGALAGLWRGGDHGDDTQETQQTDQCHDITVFPSAKLAAGACSGNGILFDISDPGSPQRLDAVTDTGFAYWHSATFNNDGTKVLLVNKHFAEALDKDVNELRESAALPFKEHDVRAVDLTAEDIDHPGVLEQ